MRVEWTGPATASLTAYLDYLQEQRPASNARAAAEIGDSVQKLARHPYVGRPSRWPGLRELSLKRWRKIVVYRIDERVIRVVAFYDARQDLTSVRPDE